MKLNYDSKELFQMQVEIVQQTTNKKIKIKKKRKKFVYPFAQERWYKKWITENIMKPFTDYIKLLIIPNLQSILNNNKVDSNTDSNTDSEFISENSFDIPNNIGDLNLLISGLQDIDTVIFQNNKDRLWNRLKELGQDIYFENTEDFKNYIKTMMDIVPVVNEAGKDKVIELFVENNVNLIRGASQDLIKSTSNTIIQGIQQGKTMRQIAEDLKTLSDKYNDYRSNLIARDQISKYWGELTKKRQTDLGIEKYIWRTAKDERVRPSHKVLEGMLCRWDDPTVYSDDNGKTWLSKSNIGGEELHTGQAINCRCYPESVLDDLLSD